MGDGSRFFRMVMGNVPLKLWNATDRSKFKK